MKPLLRSLTLVVALVLLIFMLQTWLKEVQLAVDQGTTHRDSLQFYTGATLVRGGRAASLYDLQAQRSLQEQLLQARYRSGLEFDVLPFISPPFVALAFAPLAGFSLPSFYILTGIANLFLIAAVVVALQRVAVDWPESWRLVLLTLTLMWLPVTWALMYGQVSILLAVGLALGYFALRSHRDTWGGIALSVLWVKPQYAILLLPTLLLWHRWRAAGSFMAMTLTLIIVSLSVVGIQGFVTYADLLGRIETMGPEYAMFSANYHTLSGMLLRSFGASGWAWLLLSSLMTILVVWHMRRGFGPDSYALLLLTSLLISPHTHFGDLTVLLVAAALGWEALKQRQTLSALWASLWFTVGFGLYALVMNRYLLRDSPLLTVPAMLLAVGLLVFHQRFGVPAIRKPSARVAGAERQ